MKITPQTRFHLKLTPNLKQKNLWSQSKLIKRIAFNFKPNFRFVN